MHSLTSALLLRIRVHFVETPANDEAMERPLQEPKLMLDLDYFDEVVGYSSDERPSSSRRLQQAFTAPAGKPAALIFDV